MHVPIKFPIRMSLSESDFYDDDDKISVTERVKNFMKISPHPPQSFFLTFQLFPFCLVLFLFSFVSAVPNST